MTLSFENLNQQRKGNYYKDPQEEKFLEKFNDSLLSLEKSFYEKRAIKYPFIFVFGPPRSGTTLITQLIAHCLDVGYINNFVARFWKAPLCGLKLSKNVLDYNSHAAFQSEYGSTEHLHDIHEFGYFWRSWLQKYSFENIKNAKQEENNIDWKGLKNVLANLQHEINKPMVFKNILGAYHLKKFKEVLGKVLYIYIDRDSLDTAVSILKARQRYYDDLNTWWSYVPPNYERIIDEDYWTQIAGQVYYLKQFYATELEEFDPIHKIKLHYKDLCDNPSQILHTLRDKLHKIDDSKIAIVQKPPEQFIYSSYDEEIEIKKKFKQAFKQLP